MYMYVYIIVYSQWILSRFIVLCKCSCYLILSLLIVFSLEQLPKTFTK